MAPGANLVDQSAWDDSALINSWDEAVAEYQKYHSISKSGKRLEDVLSEEELERIRTDYGDLMDEEETGSGANQNNVADHPAAAPLEEVQANGQMSEACAEKQDRATPVLQESPTAAETGSLQAEQLSATVPQALLGSVRDENLKNLMMSWYYAGYYTGLVAGQEQREPGDGPPQNK